MIFGRIDMGETENEIPDSQTFRLSGVPARLESGRLTEGRVEQSASEYLSFPPLLPASEAETPTPTNHHRPGILCK